MAATLAAVDVRAVVGADAEPDDVARLRRALGDPLLAALPPAFDRLEDLDPTGYWVVHDLHVHMALDGIGDDVDAIARTIAAALVEGIATAVAAGPGSEVIRFAGRAAFAAAYAAARTVGIAGGWVFAGLHALDPLPVPDALVAAARALDVPVDAAVLAFAEHPSWQRMVDAAPPEQAERLVRALRSTRSAGGPGSPASGEPPADLAVLLPTGRRALAASGVLALLGRAVRTAGPTARVLDAVLDLTVETGRGRPAPDGAEEPAGRPRPAAGWPPDPDGGGPGAPGEESPASPRRASGEMVESPGATAFLLLADLAELLAGTGLDERGRVSGEVRAGLLRAVLGPSVAPDDPALLLAAGAVPTGDDADEEDAPGRAARAAIAVRRLAARIEADDLLSRCHPGDADFVTRAGEPADPAAVRVTVALLRRFARHLPGFGTASAAYLVPQVLVPGGRVRVLPGMIEATLVTPPLGVLLALAGLDAFVTSPPWLPVPVTVTHEERR